MHHLAEAGLEDNEPNKGDETLEHPLCGAVQEREERDVAGRREHLERREQSAVLADDKRQGHDDEHDGLLVDVPAKEEGGVGAEGDGADEALELGLEEQGHQGHDLVEEGQEEGVVGLDLRQEGELHVADNASGERLVEVRRGGGLVEECVEDGQPLRHLDEQAVDEGVEGPDVRGPVGVGQPPREGEEACKELRQHAVVGKGPEGHGEDG